MNQKPMANPQTRTASTTKVAAREAVGEVIPATEEPVASMTDAISKTITATPDTVAAVNEEVVKSVIAATTRVTPASMTRRVHGPVRPVWQHGSSVT